MIFFTSDTHFGKGEKLLKRENRPFKSDEDFVETLISLWNEQATFQDTIYHLGDFVSYSSNNYLGWQQSLELVKKIKAKVVLVIGNNEQRIIEDCFNGNFEDFKQFCESVGFEDVKKEEFLVLKNRKFYLNHFPSKFKEGYVNLFGHTHRATGLWKPFGLNVGCDLNHFYLFSEDEIERLLIQKENFWDKDKDTLSFDYEMFSDKNSDLVELFANLEHERWAHWQKYFHSCCKQNEDCSLTIPKEKVSRWEKQAQTQYVDLTEQEKESDREWARKTLLALKNYFKNLSKK